MSGALFTGEAGGQPHPSSLPSLLAIQREALIRAFSDPSEPKSVGFTRVPWTEPTGLGVRPRGVSTFLGKQQNYLQAQGLPSAIS